MVPGTEVAFKVKATGVDLHFQWQKDRINLFDGGRYCDTNTGTLRIVEVENNDKGRYRCRVKNDKGIKFSDEVLLTVGELALMYTYELHIWR